jgi:hypothetical protein
MFRSGKILNCSIMIRATSSEPLEMINCQEEEIILSGKPMFLTGSITLENKATDHVFIKELRMVGSGGAIGKIKDQPGGAFALPINVIMGPGEVYMHHAWVTMDPRTPPGTYERQLQVGGNTRKVKMIVNENVSINLSPTALTLLGVEKNKTYTQEVMLTNTGNVAINVPTVKHNTALDMDLICRNLSKAIRIKGNDGIEATLDAFTKGVKEDITDWVQISIREASQTVEPGNSLLLHISIKLPDDVNLQHDYYGDIRIFNKTIQYTIFCNQKQHKAVE